MAQGLRALIIEKNADFTSVSSQIIVQILAFSNEYEYAAIFFFVQLRAARCKAH
jgi:hypothetical protein